MKRSQKNAAQLVKITHATYMLCLVYAGFIILADSGNLITRETIMQRWTALTGLILVNTVVWYIAHESKSKQSKLVATTLLLAMTQLVLAGLTTYWERGMASVSTIMYALPLATVATLGRPRLVTFVATFAAATYALAAVVYFNAFFNEGYRIQLWSQMFLVIGLIYSLSWMLRAYSSEDPSPPALLQQKPVRTQAMVKPPAATAPKKTSKPGASAPIKLQKKTPKKIY